ncbi:MAG: hypothetical protein KJZ90_01485 [Rhodocyclaceae bacterium]|nr:hypothetical protein [Rhodocyclaceae bacterium]
MPRPSVIPDIKLRLESYLNEREAEYISQPEDKRTPTLPVTADGKVNVRAVAKAIGLKDTQEKYLFERKELSDLINCVCEGQDVMPIGARLLQDAGDKALKSRLAQQAKQLQNASTAAVEAQAAQSELLERLQQMSAELAAVRAENLRMRAQIEAMERGQFVEIVD